MNKAESLVNKARKIINERIHKSKGNFQRVPGKWISIENKPSFQDGVKFQKKYAIASGESILIGSIDPNNNWINTKGEKIESATHYFVEDIDKPVQCIVTLVRDFRNFKQNGATE